MLRTDLSRDNSLVADVRTGRRLTPWWLAIVLGGGLLPLLVFAATPLVSPPPKAPLTAALAYRLLKWLVAEPFLQTYYSSIITVLVFGLAALLLFLWVRLAEGRPFHTIGFRPRRALVGVALGLGLALLFTTLVMGVLGGTGMLRMQAPSTDPIGMAATQAIVVAAVMYTVQASTEEMIYRGWLQNVVALRIGPPIAIAVSIVAFVAAHVDNPGFGILPGINLTLFAAFLSLLALRTGGLWASCAWHAGWNWMLSNIWGVPLSGLPPEGGSAMVWALTGPQIFTGGEWGPEGGLLATAVLTGGTVWVALWRGLGDRIPTAAPDLPPATANWGAATYRMTPRR